MQRSSKNNKRLSIPQIDFIKDQFSNFQPDDRNLKLLDRILKPFKFFKRFE